MTIATLRGGQADLPSSESTASYWHTDPSEQLLGHRSTSELPVEADVVIVGSGITGAFAARELVKGGRSVLLLEAREACWGATGRVSPFHEYVMGTRCCVLSMVGMATFG
jgi:heterodisulfide reductase subunit A-like polyferredoxin